MKIALYGGSFNPVHQAHIKIAQYVIDELALDQLFFIPAFKSPFKKKHPYAPAHHRVAMLDLVKVPKSTVSLFEINRQGVSYTIDTVRYFIQKYPLAKIYLIIGSDQLSKLAKWRDIQEIAEQVQITVVKRDKNFVKANLKKFNALLLNNQLFPGSSTSFRSGDFQEIDPQVNAYIGQHHLYIPDLMQKMLDPSRHKHSLAVAKYATTYAKSLNEDVHKAWVAGCLHDITKCWTKERHLAFLSKYQIAQNEVRDHELHSLTGFLWIKYEYKLDDPLILQAVLKHTNLADQLSTMDKIIYAADKLCDGRTHPGIQKDRQLMLEDFDRGFANLITLMYQILIKNRNLSAEQKAIYQLWMAKQ